MARREAPADMKSTSCRTKRPSASLTPPRPPTPRQCASCPFSAPASPW